MGLKIFVDTDVIIDFLIDRQPHALAASQIFDLGYKKLIKIFASTLCINNVHYIVKKVMGDKKARVVIDELLNFISILDVSENDIRNAIKSDFKDFEDAIQHSVAAKQKDINSIITRNTKDFKNSGIAVFTPDAFVMMLQNES